jgi:hypothetical protein
MNEFTKLIESLRGMLKQVADRANELLKTQPPLEQFEKTSPVYSGLLSCGYAIDFLKNTASDITRQLDAIDPEAAMMAGAEDVMKKKIASGELMKKEDFEAKLTSGEFVKKTDAETAAGTAADNREKAVRAEILLIENRRKEVSTPKSETEPALLSIELASRLSPEVLTGEDYIAKVTKVANRVKQLKAAGVETPELLNSAADTAVDEGGDKVFTERLTWMADVSKKAGLTGGAPVIEPFAGGGGGGGGGNAELEGVF